VYGLLHRADRNYLEAIKAYRRRYRIDGGDLQILRDLSLLHDSDAGFVGLCSDTECRSRFETDSTAQLVVIRVVQTFAGPVRWCIASDFDIYLGTLAEDSPGSVQELSTQSELQMYRELSVVAEQ
jgi:hypothetical protein